jgi:eukaryotic-like serine/threonine-protein kinase
VGKENSIPKSDPENPKNSPDSGSAPARGADTGVGGETTISPGESGAAVVSAEGRVSIGPYVLIKKLGEGGMGQVWLAEQTAPVKRRVALKLIKGGLYDSAVMQRFEAERQSLAVMNHPAIAKVFDAGSTMDGQPYFVMEYVDGPTITRYCDNKKLKIRERLKLFIKVCEGVQHAHQKAIIHRDLKPSNILIAEVDEKPVPRIIDFGIAKAVSSQPGPEQTQFTEMGALIGTRGFISPEQADPNILDVDTRTDVYSLGVVLYVLLTGMLPFDSEGGRKKSIDEVLRELREEDPPSPSTKVSTEKVTGTAAAEKRGTETKQLVRLLRGDLDWITMKAVERDRARRYGTPSELAADIERYLENRPVVARPASGGYRLKKYVQRHWVGVVVGAAATALLVAFAITQAVQLRRITRERDRADRVANFMTSMFKVSDPSESRGNTITAREILDKASKDIDTGLAKDPELQGQMIDTMARVYANLGLYHQALSLQQRAVDIWTRVLGPQNSVTLSSKYFLAWDLHAEGHVADAEKLYRETLDIQRRVLGPSHPNTLRSMMNLASVLQTEGHYADAEKLERETLEIQRRVLGPEDRSTLRSMLILAGDLYQEGRFAEAEKLYRETLDIQRRVFGPEEQDTLMLTSNLGRLLAEEGRYAEAEKLHRETLDIQRRVLGPEHVNTLMTMAYLGNDLLRQSRFAEAETLERQTLEIDRRVLGPEHPLTVDSMMILSSDLAAQGRYAESEKLHRETLDIQRRLYGLEDPNTLISMGNLAEELIHDGHDSEAETLLRQALEIQRRLYGPEHPLTARSTFNLAVIAAHERHLDSAFSLLRDAVDHGLAADLDLYVEEDPDLKSLHGDPRFPAIVADAKQRAAASQKPN